MKNFFKHDKFNEHKHFWELSQKAAFKKEEELKQEMNIYLIARIWRKAHSWNEEVVSHLKPPIQVFIPHKHNPYDVAPESFQQEIHDVDMGAICKSQGALLLPGYGNDCAYEVGIYKMLNVVHGKGHILFPVIAFTRYETDFLKDWMVKGGITHVITDNPKTLEHLRSDPMLSSANRKIVKIDSLEHLHDAVFNIISSTRKELVREVERKISYPNGELAEGFNSV